MRPWCAPTSRKIGRTTVWSLFVGRDAVATLDAGLPPSSTCAISKSAPEDGSLALCVEDMATRKCPGQVSTNMATLLEGRSSIPASSASARPPNLPSYPTVECLHTFSAEQY
ncbi:hypothetical protein L209DRAFT_759028 [Thermothelomyces heterothallicus CBS 203.75]